MQNGNELDAVLEQYDRAEVDAVLEQYDRAGLDDVLEHVTPSEAEVNAVLERLEARCPCGV